MPDLATRSKHEDETALLILLYLQDAEDTLRAGQTVNWLEWTTQLSRELTPLLAATYLESAEQLAGQFGGWLQDGEERARQWATNQANWLAASMATATQAAVASAIAGAQSRAAVAGDALTPETWKEIVDSLAETVLSPTRAEGAGITESTGAITEGEVFAAAELERIGIFLFPYWVTERDDKVCPICRPLDGRPREEWWSEHAYGPPAHPRCRCTLEWREER